MTFGVAAALVVALAALVVAVGARHDARRASQSLAEVLALSRGAAEDVDWQLQWIEPGVFFLTNNSPSTPALQVDVESSLTPVSGGSAAAARASEQRVNPGAWVEVRHVGVGPAMSEDLRQLQASASLAQELRRRPGPLPAHEQVRLAAADERVYELHDRVEYTLAYTVSWRTRTGVPCQQTRSEQRLIPSPVEV